MTYLSAFLCGLALTYGFLFFAKKPLFKTVLLAAKQLDLLFSGHLSDEERDWQILTNLPQLLRSLLRFFATFALVLALAFSPFYLLPQTESPNSLLLWVCGVLGALPALIPRRGSSGYNAWERVLHRIALRHYELSKLFFGGKQLSLEAGASPSPKPFVIVTGLARGGTTALAQMLHQTGQFHSLTYSDMPFLLAPQISRRLNAASLSIKKRRPPLRERPHGDGLMVGRQSIEALDEFFFKAFLHDAYIQEGCLKEHELPEEVFQRYLQYQDQVRGKDEGTLYLSKNNNFLLRFRSVKAHISKEPTAELRLLVLLRPPMEHAASLLRQHLRFVQKQQEDPFILEYMDWLGHHEFGLNHKPFCFKGKSVPPNSNPEDINYWIQLWIQYYQEVEELAEDSALSLISQAELRENPNWVIGKIAGLVGRPLPLSDLQGVEPSYGKLGEHLAPPEQDLLGQAQRLYDKLLPLCI